MSPDDVVVEPIDPFELEEWNVVSFTDPRDQSVYDIIDGRVLIAFKNPPQLPQVDPNYFDVQRPPNDPYYAQPYPLLIGDPAVDAFIAAESLTVFSEWPAIKCMAVLLPPGQTVADAVANWPSEYPDLIEAVDPDALGGNCTDPNNPPNDDLFNDIWAENDQWAICENGGSPFHIRAQAAWRQPGGYGRLEVVVAVVDTGVDTEVLDLQYNSTPWGCWVGENLKQATVFSPRANGGGAPHRIDENRSEDNAREIGHGTCVAGIISARMDNDGNHVYSDGDDTAGIAYRNWYFPLAMKFKMGYATSTQVNAFYAVACVKGFYNPNVYGPGANVPSYNIEVMNCSFYMKGNSTAQRIVNDVGKYIVVVGAAGNNGSATNSDFPASHPRVMSVAAYDYIGHRSVWGDDSSNYAPDTDICAPGSDIVTCDMLGFNDYGKKLGYNVGQVNYYFKGTSAAAPHVAAVAALVISRWPSLTPTAAIQKITGSEVYDLSPPLRNYGRLNAGGAME